MNWGRSQEKEKKFDVLDMGAARIAVTIGEIPSLDRFQAQPEWEMSDYRGPSKFTWNEP